MFKIEGGVKLLKSMEKKSSSNQPLVSIITVCLNSEKYLEDTIKSVINQTYQNIEYIIIDGGSKDKTLDIIKKYEDKIDYWISQPDKGLYDAMNKGIRLAKGELIGLLNSDDWYHPQAVENIIDGYLKAPDTDVFYGDLLYVRMPNYCLNDREYDIEGKYKRYVGKHENMFNQWQLSHPTCFLKATAYANRLFDISIRLSADFDFLLYLYMNNKKFFYINKPITYFRPIGLTSKTNYTEVIEYFRIRGKYNFFKAFKLFLYDNIRYIRAKLYIFKIAIMRKIK